MENIFDYVQRLEEGYMYNFKIFIIELISNLNFLIDLPADD